MLKNKEVTNKDECEFETSSTGQASGFHGMEYQVNLIMLWTYRVHRSDFAYYEVSTEDSTRLGKFDDYYLRVVLADGTWLEQFIQCKHAINENSTLSLTDLFPSLQEKKEVSNSNSTSNQASSSRRKTKEQSNSTVKSKSLFFSRRKTMKKSTPILPPNQLITSGKETKEDSNSTLPSNQLITSDKETKEDSNSTLKPEKDGPFVLKKYFPSILKIRKCQKSGNDKQMFIIYTNRSFKSGDLLESITEDVKDSCVLQTELKKFKTDFEQKQSFIDAISDGTDAQKKLAKEFLENLYFATSQINESEIESKIKKELRVEFPELYLKNIYHRIYCDTRKWLQGIPKITKNKDDIVIYFESLKSEFSRLPIFELRVPVTNDLGHEQNIETTSRGSHDNKADKKFDEAIGSGNSEQLLCFVQKIDGKNIVSVSASNKEKAEALFKLLNVPNKYNTSEENDGTQDTQRESRKILYKQNIEVELAEKQRHQEQTIRERNFLDNTQLSEMDADETSARKKQEDEENKINAKIRTKLYNLADLEPKRKDRERQKRAINEDISKDEREIEQLNNCETTAMYQRDSEKHNKTITDLQSKLRNVRYTFKESQWWQEEMNINSQIENEKQKLSNLLWSEKYAKRNRDRHIKTIKDRIALNQKKLENYAEDEKNQCSEEKMIQAEIENKKKKLEKQRSINTQARRRWEIEKQVLVERIQRDDTILKEFDDLKTEYMKREELEKQNKPATISWTESAATETAVMFIQETSDTELKQNVATEKSNQDEQNSASQLYAQLVKILWSEIWQAEQIGDASKKLIELINIIQLFGERDPENKQFLMWNSILSLKQSESKEFKVGNYFQGLGNRCRQQTQLSQQFPDDAKLKFKDILAYFVLATNEFQKGIELNNDINNIKKFEACIDLLDENIADTQKSLRNIQLKYSRHPEIS